MKPKILDWALRRFSAFSPFSARKSARACRNKAGGALIALLLAGFPAWLPAEESYATSFRSGVLASLTRNVFHPDDPTNPDRSLNAFEEEELLIAPSFDLKIAEGYDAFLKSVAHGVFGNAETDRFYLGEFYYLRYWGNSQWIAGKYVESSGNAYFEEPARLLLKNSESGELTRILGRDYEAGNLSLKFRYDFDAFSVEAIASDYEDEDFFDEEIKESQFRLQANLDLFGGDTSATLSFHRVSSGHDSWGLSVSQRVGEDSIAYLQAARKRLNRRIVPFKVAEARGFQPAIYGYAFDATADFDSYLLGFQYTSPADSWNVILEYYGDQEGLSEEEAQMTEEGLKAAATNDVYKDDRFASAQGNPFAGFMRNSSKFLRDRNYRRNYLNLRFTDGDLIENWEAVGVVRQNLDDRSRLVRFELEKDVGNHLAGISVNSFQGAEFSEFGMQPFQRQIEAFLELSL